MSKLLRGLMTGLLLLPLAGCPSDDDDDVTQDTGVADVGATDTGAADTGSADSGVDAGSDPFARLSCDDVTGNCEQFTADQVDDLLDTINALSDDTTLVLGEGTFSFDNAVTIRQADGVTLTGQGIDVTVLDFSGQTTQSNGVDVIGDDFSISDLTIIDANKDALRIEDSTNVKIQRVKTTWSGGPLETNGAYGIYPVRCVNVLLEDSEAYNSSDAGLYIGQSQNVIVRRNIAKQNVAGLEVENTQFADVYENLVEDNTGGLVVFDLPGNPVIGRDVYVHDNIIRGNNRDNFARSGTTVSQIPAGTGTFALASRRLEIANNTYEDNKTVDIALIPGFAINSSTAAWALTFDEVVGSTVGLDLPTIGNEVFNYETGEVWVHDNSHSNFGTMPDGRDPDGRELGALISIVYFRNDVGPVDAVLYLAIGESVIDPMVPANNTNDFHICVGDEGDGTFASMDLEALAAMLDNFQFPTQDDIYQPAAPFVPFDCSGFTNGPIPDVVLPF